MTEEEIEKNLNILKSRFNLHNFLIPGFRKLIQEGAINIDTLEITFRNNKTEKIIDFLKRIFPNLYAKTS